MAHGKRDVHSNRLAAKQAKAQNTWTTMHIMCTVMQNKGELKSLQASRLIAYLKSILTGDRRRTVANRSSLLGFPQIPNT